MKTRRRAIKRKLGIGTITPTYPLNTTSLLADIGDYVDATAAGTISGRGGSGPRVTDAPYNAVGDGVTDDGPAFAAFYAALAAGTISYGFVPYTPTGYLIDTPIVLDLVDGDGFSVVGQAAGSGRRPFLKWTGGAGSGPMLTFNSAHGVEYKGLHHVATNAAYDGDLVVWAGGGAGGDCIGNDIDITCKGNAGGTGCKLYDFINGKVRLQLQDFNNLVELGGYVNTTDIWGAFNGHGTASVYVNLTAASQDINIRGIWEPGSGGIAGNIVAAEGAAPWSGGSITGWVGDYSTSPTGQGIIDQVSLMGVKIHLLVYGGGINGIWNPGSGSQAGNIFSGYYDIGSAPIIMGDQSYGAIIVGETLSDTEALPNNAHVITNTGAIVQSGAIHFTNQGNAGAAVTNEDFSVGVANDKIFGSSFPLSDGRAGIWIDSQGTLGIWPRQPGSYINLYFADKDPPNMLDLAMQISEHGIGFFGEAPTSGQPTASHETSGYTAGTGTAVTIDGKHTGGIGSTAYTLGDIVAALKDLGLIAS